MIELFRKRIESQVFNLTGLALNTIDYEHPAGDPGLFGPEAICWRVHSHFPAMLCGGISALMLQMLHPSALAGVWDHSNFRADMLGRLRRTSQFIAGTTFASRADALALIDRVNRIHAQVVGFTQEGQPYRAQAPELIGWVHCAEVYSFINGYQTYSQTPLSSAQIDAYLEEVALIARSLGADEVPLRWVDLKSYLQTMRPELRFDQRTEEILSAVINAQPATRIARIPQQVFNEAAIDLLPDWARQMTGFQRSAKAQRRTRQQMEVLSKLLVWAIRNGASSRARRRVGA